MPEADGQDLQVGMGGCLNGLKASVADPGHHRKVFSAVFTALLAYPAKDEIGEGIGHEPGTEALLVIDQDDLPEVSGGAGSQVDGELFSELPAARQLLVNQWRFRGPTS